MKQTSILVAFVIEKEMLHQAKEAAKKQDRSFASFLRQLIAKALKG